MIVVTRGFGPGASIPFVVTAGYGAFAAAGTAFNPDVELTVSINRTVSLSGSINRTVGLNATINRTITEETELT